MLLLVCSACVFNACDDDEKTKEPELSDLITDIKVPEKFLLVSTDAEITGKGFEPSDAQLFWEDADENRTEVKDAEFTTTGVYFKTPEKAGDYSVILRQGGKEMILGKIRVVEPIANVVMPMAFIKPGEKVNIKATGLRSTAKVVLVDMENKHVDVEANITATELTFDAPATAGYYTVILSEDDNDDILGYLSVISKRVSKITQVTKSLPMQEEGSEEEPIDDSYTISYVFDYAEDGTLGFVHFLDNGEELYAYSFSYPEGENKVIVTSGEEEYATYALENGLVVKHSYYEDDYFWSYDEKGYLTLADESSFEYDGDGNLTDAATAFQFEYGEDKNSYSNVHPFGYLLYSLGIYPSDEMLIPYFLDKCGKHASKLPVKFSSDLYEIAGEEFSYQWDSDKKFITGIKYVLQEQEYVIIFEYED